MKGCEVWYEVWGSDEFQWEFITDFDTLSQAEAFVAESELVDDYMDLRITRATGLGI